MRPCVHAWRRPDAGSPNICWRVSRGFQPGAVKLRGTIRMKDMHAHLEKLRRDAAECTLIRDLATDPIKRELFTRMAQHLVTLAGEAEAAIIASSSIHGA